MPIPPTADDLRKRLDTLRREHPGAPPDAAIFLMGAHWALRFETELNPDQLALIERSLNRATHRLESLAGGAQNWHHRPGPTIRGFRSKVDGSIQPMGVILPRGFDPNRRHRLDVVLHGSMPARALSYIEFLKYHDTGDDADDTERALYLPTPPGDDWIEVHPLGRVENCYRFAGETDVFEAIEAACNDYPIDRDRIVLRGFSMGASGTWHVGLKHPDRFAAIAPYAGYVDTRLLSTVPLSHFVKIDELPEHQDRALTINDAIGYAANVGVVPTIAAIGAKDIFHDYCHPLMAKAVAAEGLRLTNLVSPTTAHTFDPAVKAEQFRQIAEHASRGIDRAPNVIRFVTWTLRYADCHWVQLRGLNRHYDKTVFHAERRSDEGVIVREVTNVTRFALRPEAWRNAARRIQIEGVDIGVPTGDGAVEFERHADGWRLASAAKGGLRKMPGLQGPIDDAFSGPFMCVRGTGTAWNATIARYAEASLRRFEDHWSRYWRGDLPTTNDNHLTDDDATRFNLALFGDPGSNPWIARCLPALRCAGVEWTNTRVDIAGRSASAADHTPVIILPSPFAPRGDRYVVINSGHTFHHAQTGKINYLIFPRLGDWALLRVTDAQPADPRDELPEVVLAAGFCDETWKVTGSAR